MLNRNNMKPLVSVIMPAFNDENFITQSIKSVLDQDYKNLELIVFSDGSTDETNSIASRFEKLDRRVKLYTQDNQGVSVARNNAIKQASGEYIAFIDSDDVWCKNKISLQLNEFMKDPELGFVSTLALIIDKSNHFNGLITGIQLNGFVFDEILKNNGVPCGSTPLIKKEVINRVGYFDKSLKVCQDYDYWIRCAQHCKFKTINIPLVAYRRSKNRLSTFYGLLFEECKTIIEDNFKQGYIKDENLSEYRFSGTLNAVIAAILDEDIDNAITNLKLFSIKQSILNKKALKVYTYLLLSFLLPTKVLNKINYLFVSADNKKFINNFLFYLRMS